jgi:hypothetical protein
MKPHHIVLISGCAIIIVGIILIFIAGTNASLPFLSQNMLVANDIIKPGESKISLNDVTVLGPTMYIIFKSDPSNIPITASVKEPNGSVVSLSSFSQNLVTSFKPQTTGKYAITVTNGGITDVKTSMILGYIPLFGENAKPNYSALQSIFIGSLLLILGSFGFVIGLLKIIKDKSSRFEEKICIFSKQNIERIINYFRSDVNEFEKSNILGSDLESQKTDLKQNGK